MSPRSGPQTLDLSSFISNLYASLPTNCMPWDLPPSPSSGKMEGLGWNPPLHSLKHLKLTASSPLKIDLNAPKGNEKVFQPSIFKCYVSFREGHCFSKWKIQPLSVSKLHWKQTFAGKNQSACSNLKLLDVHLKNVKQVGPMKWIHKIDWSLIHQFMNHSKKTQQSY